jgi:hypothetical protein
MVWGIKAEKNMTGGDQNRNKFVQPFPIHYTPYGGIPETRLQVTDR